MNVPDLLVTVTDTGIGKTVIAAALVLSRRASGLDAVGFKPIESGVTDGEMADSAVLGAASGVSEPLAEPIARLAEPLAPAVAAERAGTTLDPAAFEARIEALRRWRGVTLPCTSRRCRDSTPSSSAAPASAP